MISILSYVHFLQKANDLMDYGIVDVIAIINLSLFINENPLQFSMIVMKNHQIFHKKEKLKLK